MIYKLNADEKDIGAYVDKDSAVKALELFANSHQGDEALLIRIEKIAQNGENVVVREVLVGVAKPDLYIYQDDGLTNEQVNNFFDEADEFQKECEQHSEIDIRIILDNVVDVKDKKDLLSINPLDINTFEIINHEVKCDCDE